MALAAELMRSIRHTVTPKGGSTSLFKAVLQGMGGQRQSSALRVEKGSADIVMWEAGLLQRPHLNGPPQGLGGILRPESYIPQLGCGPLMDEQRAQAGKECRNGRGLGYQHLWASSALWPFDMISALPRGHDPRCRHRVHMLVTPPHSTLC